MTANPKVDEFLINGCMRCSLGGTPNCKVHRWAKELILLRQLVLECGLDEGRKWGFPCYTLQNKNVLMLTVLKESCTLSFFKGVLLSDELGLLESPGENSRSVRMIRFTNAGEILSKSQVIGDFIFQAMEVERNGIKMPKEQPSEPIPGELKARFVADPVFKEAFEALTPGRQRGYILYFAAPKQSKTREARIAKHVPNILNGKGLHDDRRTSKQRP